MSNYIIDNEKCVLCKKCIEVCPYDALEIVDGKLQMNSACKACNSCVTACPVDAISAVKVEVDIDKDEYQDILVFAEQLEGEIHPVTFELMGKGRELADQLDQQLNVVLLGYGFDNQVDEILAYGADNVYVYDQEELAHFSIEPYAAAIEDCVNRIKPTIILMGATSIGRSLAPRVSTRFRTGLTADCTILNVKENTDLIQTRPAFGGNIMAQIITPNHRPQMATVRYKVMEPAEKVDNPIGKVVEFQVESSKLKTRAKCIEVTKKPEVESIEDAEVIVAAGRGIREEKDLELVRELAQLLGAKVGTTRPLIEKGWTTHQQQIGLSGRSVRPKLIITVGISGAVQFTAGMSNSECIFAINNDPEASIFDAAHYGVVGDLYEVVPRLIEKLKNGEGIMPNQEVAVAGE